MYVSAVLIILLILVIIYLFRIRAKWRSAEQEVGEQKLKLSRVQSQLDECERSIGCSEYKLEIEAQKKKISEYENQIEALKKQVKELMEKSACKECQSNLLECRKSLEDKLKEITALTSQIATLNSQMKELNAQLAAAKAEMEKLRKSLDEYQQRNRELQSANEQLDSENKELRSRIAVQIQRNKELQSANEQLDSENKEMRSKIATQTQQIIDLKSQMENLNATIKALRSQVDELQGHIKSLSSDVSQLRLTIQSLNEEIKACSCSDRHYTVSGNWSKKSEWKNYNFSNLLRVGQIDIRGQYFPASLAKYKRNATDRFRVCMIVKLPADNLWAVYVISREGFRELQDSEIFELWQFDTNYGSIRTTFAPGDVRRDGNVLVPERTINIGTSANPVFCVVFYESGKMDADHLSGASDWEGGLVAGPCSMSPHTGDYQFICIA